MKKQEIEKIKRQEMALNVITGVHSFYELLNKYEIEKKLSPFVIKEICDRVNDLIVRWSEEENEDQLNYLLDEMDSLIKHNIPELR